MAAGETEALVGDRACVLSRISRLRATTLKREAKGPRPRIIGQRCGRARISRKGAEAEELGMMHHRQRQEHLLLLLRRG